MADITALTKTIETLRELSNVVAIDYSGLNQDVVDNIDTSIVNIETFLDEYRNELIELVKARYEERIQAILKKAAEVCAEEGIVCDKVFAFDGDEYSWVLPTWRSQHDKDTDNNNNRVDIQFEIAEAKAYNDDPLDGINFALNITEWGGRMLGGMTPHNYTDQCWVPAHVDKAVNDRFLLIEEADLSTLPNLVKS